MLNKSKLKRLFIQVGIGLTAIWSKLVYAAVYAMAGGGAGDNGPSLGQASTNMADTIGMFTNIFYNICYVLGGAMLLGSVIQYKNHRDNPSQVRLSTPIFLIIIGFVLIALPFIGKVSSAASAGGGS